MRNAYIWFAALLATFVLLFATATPANGQPYSTGTNLWRIHVSICVADETTMACDNFASRERYASREECDAARPVREQQLRTALEAERLRVLAIRSTCAVARGEFEA